MVLSKRPPKRVLKPPKKYVPKKNLFDGALESGVYSASTGAKTAFAGLVRSVNSFKVNGGKTYTVSARDKIMTSSNTRFTQFDSTGAFVKSDLALSITVQPNTSFLVFQSGDIIIGDLVQLEEGSIATPYEPYQLTLPKARTGLSFNGVTDYLQLPSMTMDSVEIECLIDSVQPNTNPFIFDARTGSANGYVYKSNSGTADIGSDVSSLLVNGVSISRFYSSIPKDVRIKLRATMSVFTSGLFLFNNYISSPSTKTKGILYKVTCYLNGGIVAQYDFENPRSLVGTSVLQSAVNLIPSFEDSRWGLHANSKVMGKDVLHLDATGGYQYSTIWINVSPQTNYLLNINHNSFITVNSEVDANIVATTGLKQVSFNSGSSNKIKIYLTNTTSGSFDFIRPQLYALDGKEGTIYGVPTQGVKHAKRRLYAKR